MNLRQSDLELERKEVTLSTQDRILILAPHPDDEVLGCGGVIQKALDMDLPLKIVFFTYGDNNEWSFWVYRKHPVLMPKAIRTMALIRHDEAVKAGESLGVHPERLIFLGYPDLRTLNIWNYHWGNNPVNGMLSEVKKVPYENAFRPGAPYKGEEILKDLKTILRDFKPTRIFVSHPADHHPDHRAFYLFTRVALWDLRDEIKAELYPYIIHYRRWPKPGGLNLDMPLLPPDFFQKIIPWQILKLSSDEVENKDRAIKKHRSQYNSNRKYLLSFIRSNELFGDCEPVTLTSQLLPVSLNFKSKEDLIELSEGLIKEEHLPLFGLGKRFFALKEGNLTINTTLSRSFGKKVGLSIYVFGYRFDKDFMDMPKLRIKLGAREHDVFNQGRRLSKDIIKVERKPKEITVRIPLEILGNPERILTSTNTYVGAVHLNLNEWRILEMGDEKSE